MLAPNNKPPVWNYAESLSKFSSVTWTHIPQPSPIAAKYI